MLALIEQGHVGLVVVREVSRLSRDPFLAETFLKTAIRARVLIFANGRMFDSATGELAELFVFSDSAFAGVVGEPEPKPEHAQGESGEGAPGLRRRGASTRLRAPHARKMGQGFRRGCP